MKQIIIDSVNKLFNKPKKCTLKDSFKINLKKLKTEDTLYVSCSVYKGGTYIGSEFCRNNCPFMMHSEKDIIYCKKKFQLKF